MSAGSTPTTASTSSSISSKIPNAKSLVEQAKISPYHIGSWAYVYTIGYRPDMVPAGIKFDSWNDLWNPELKGKISAPDFDASHLVVVAAKLEGGDAATWEKGSDKLKALKPNFKAYYANDAASQQLMQNGEAPVQVMLSMNAYYIASQGVPVKLAIPKEGAVLGIDTIGIMKGTKKADLAYKFINIMLDPAVQTEIATLKKGSPVVTNAKLDAGSCEAARRVHDGRPVEQGSAGHRPQAARRENRRMAKVVHRERHQLTTGGAPGPPTRRARSSAFALSGDIVLGSARDQHQRLLRARRPFLKLFTAPAVITARSFAVSMVAILQYSVRAHIPGSLDVGGFTLANFAAMLRPLYARVFLDTVWLCLLTAVISLVLGYPLAYALVRSTNLFVKSFILIVTVTPLFLGEVVRTYSWIVVLGNNGFVNSVLLQLGIIAAAAAAAVHGDRRHHRARACHAAGRGRHAGGGDRAYRSGLREGGRKPRRRPGAGLPHGDAAAVRPRHRRRPHHRLRLDLQRLCDAATGRRRQGQHGVEPGLSARLCEFQFSVRGGALRRGAGAHLCVDLRDADFASAARKSRAALMARPLSHRMMSFAGRALVVAILGFIILPAFVVAIASFNDKALLSFPPQQLSLRWFYNAINYRDFQTGFYNGLIVMLASSIIALFVGAAFAFVHRPLRVPRQECHRRAAAGAAGGAALHRRASAC